jgi:hypothetical protein
MATERFCRSCKEWHKIDEWPVECFPRRAHSASDLPTPQFITDTMEPVQSQLDGQMYDSKAALRATYKQAGVVEVGNDSSVIDPKPAPKIKPDRKQISETVDKALSRAGFGA